MAGTITGFQRSIEWRQARARLLLSFLTQPIQQAFADQRNRAAS